tara:strand:- start:367 stop:588 length:222 start_codon:yes stop_codon:yes gene_type:complete
MIICYALMTVKKCVRNHICNHICTVTTSVTTSVTDMIICRALLTVKKCVGSRRGALSAPLGEVKRLMRESAAS